MVSFEARAQGQLQPRWTQGQLQRRWAQGPAVLLLLQHPRCPVTDPPDRQKDAGCRPLVSLLWPPLTAGAFPWQPEQWKQLESRRMQTQGTPEKGRPGADLRKLHHPQSSHSPSGRFSEEAASDL